MVERDLAKVDVAGSTPVSRSRFIWLPRNVLPRAIPTIARTFMQHEGVVDIFRWESYFIEQGAVPKW